MNKGKFIGLVLGVILFIVVIAGFTYAYITWTSEKLNYNVGSKCFIVHYDKGNDITGMMIPSNDYTGGLSTTVKVNIDSSCDINATGKLYLNTLDTTSSNLYRGLLKYQVVQGSNLIDDGVITDSGVITIDLGVLTMSTSAVTEYTVYVWIDNNLVENSDINSLYYGNIRTEAIQFE